MSGQSYGSPGLCIGQGWCRDICRDRRWERCAHLEEGAAAGLMEVQFAEPCTAYSFRGSSTSPEPVDLSHIGPTKSGANDGHRHDSWSQGGRIDIRVV